MSAGKKMERARYARQKRTAPVHIHVFLIRSKAVRYIISTDKVLET